MSGTKFPLFVDSPILCCGLQPIVTKLNIKNGGYSSFDYWFKVVFLGEREVGKTSVTFRMAHQLFPIKSYVFSGMDCRSRIVMKSSKSLYVELWDTSFVEVDCTREIVLDFFDKTKAVVLVFDITNRTSFDKLPEWLKLARKHCAESVPIYVLGNKRDLNAFRVVYMDEIENFVTRENIASFEMSAKSGKGAEEALMSILLQLQTTEEEKESEQT